MPIAIYVHYHTLFVFIFRCVLPYHFYPLHLMQDHLLIRNLVRTQSHSFSHFFQTCSGGLPGRVKVDRQDHDKLHQGHMDLHPNLHQETPTVGQHYQRMVGQDLKVQLKALDQLQGQHSSIMDLSYPPGHPLRLGIITLLLHQL